MVRSAKKFGNKRFATQMLVLWSQVKYCRTVAFFLASLPLTWSPVSSNKPTNVRVINSPVCWSHIMQPQQAWGQRHFLHGFCQFFLSALCKTHAFMENCLGSEMGQLAWCEKNVILVQTEHQALPTVTFDMCQNVNSSKHCFPKVCWWTVGSSGELDTGLGSAMKCPWVGTEDLLMGGKPHMDEPIGTVNQCMYSWFGTNLQLHPIVWNLWGQMPARESTGFTKTKGLIYCRYACWCNQYWAMYFQRDDR